MVAGQTYQVSVTMNNTGVTTWTRAGNYKLSTMNPMKNNLWGFCVVDMNAGDSVLPGQTKTFTFNVIAPSVLGTYNFQWIMLKEPSATDSYSEFFGGLSQNVTFTFTAPSPTLTFAANPSSITPGQSTTLSWTLASSGTCAISDACSCFASEDWGGTKALSGTQTVSPTKNSIYTLECSCPCGSAKKSTTVYVSNMQVSQKIKIRTASNGPEFYNSVTGGKFIPRGNNYLRLYDYDGSGNCYSQWHSVFDHYDYIKKLEGIYNATRAELALAKMQSDGYNVVRVYLNNKAMSGQKGGPEIDPEYIKNVVDFLKRARSHGIYVILTAGSLGTNYLYNVTSLPWEFDHINSLYLWQERIDALKHEWKDIINEIRAQDATTLSTIFGYEVSNEATFLRGLKPFSLQSGLVTVAEGGTYDMADANQKTLMEERSATYFANQITQAVKAVDTEALVTVSLFLGAGRIRLLPVESSNIDYVDIHIYTSGTSDEKIHEYFIYGEVDKLSHTKPIIASELGVYSQQGTYYAYYPDVNAAAAGAVTIQNISCEYGFQGWILWTWDAEEQGGWWTALSENGEVGRSLSPVYRSDPCIKEATASTLVISGVSTSSIGENGAMITWTSDKPATSQVEYGETSSYGSLTTLDNSLVTSHSVTLSGLSPGTTYHFRVRSRDGNGGEKISGDYVFSTGGLAAYLKMNLDNNPAIGETTTKAVDQSPYGNNGTFYNHVAWTTEGKYGGGVRFDGIDDYIQTAANNALDSSSAGTVTTWIKTSANSAQAIVGYTTSSILSSNYVWRVRNNVLEMAWNFAGGGGNWNLINGTTPVNDGNWHFVAFVSDGLNRNKIYLDGVEQTTAFTSTSSSTNDRGWTDNIDGVGSYNHHINLGGLNRGTSPTNWFNGTIDHVRIWKKALTSEEIMQLLADLNSDDNVDISDLVLIAANFGKTSNFDTTLDIDNSGKIDIYDIIFVASRFR
jgi:hypothetical protein